MTTPLQRWAVTLICLTQSANAITLTFDELQNNESVLDYYNGGFGSSGTGPGPSYGITFGPIEFVQNHFLAPSPPNILFIGNETIDVPGGFNAFSLDSLGFFGAPFVRVWDGVGGTGALLTQFDQVA
ncbi:MAG: hypothetical protein L0Z50_33345 [Verrucomicrobiales bacterium]|nr:hypothetical protein [Verrucomicrobiales bacterium]